MKCVNCGKELTGRQTKFCSRECQRRYLSKNGYNSKYSQKKDYHGVLLKNALIQRRGGKCECCGYDKNIAALEFHHKDPSQKKFTLCSRNLERFSDEEILEEFNKCLLLCSNCHAELHHPELDVSNISNLREQCKSIKYRKKHLGLIQDIY